MTLEATVICLDNSEFSRNTDYGTSRLLQQQDAANFISGIKTQQNPENLVGILSMAGDRVELRVTPTSDLGKTLQAMHEIRIYGKIDLIRGIQIAQLALKHRLNKNLKQRIVCFIGSPICDEVNEKQLEKLGKILKKNNVALDIISFGEISENHDKLQTLIDAVNNNGTSNLIEIPSSTSLTDAVMTSPIVLGEGMEIQGDNVTPGVDASGFEFGIDPNADPELYMALRMSMEEENARQARLQTNNIENTGQTNDIELRRQDQVPTIDEINAMEVDDELRQALIMSIQDFKGETNMEVNNQDDVTISSTNTNGPNFINELIGSIPGVNVNDPRIQAALREASQQQNTKDEEKSDPKKPDLEK
ncbi:ubiquitin interaction motif family protein [Cryptosporidium andersoni]|uniref:Ubiquitin interaction motif family protein n=1 Tax=Cryptosporidium andersoni TaxID=117008 RepID=A0A1J4MS87_9CRYT|nr:ubiquitin interaction motif family protein [Cryptosporidium andersoni]